MSMHKTAVIVEDDPDIRHLIVEVLEAAGFSTVSVGNGIDAIAPRAESMGSVHPEVLAALGGLYADTISHLRPRIMVQGNPHYLGQAGVVSEIRALLLAAVRSAMLWRQLGGSQWHFLLARRAMVDAVVRQLR